MKFWAMKAYMNHWIAKVVKVLIIVGLIFGVLYLLRDALPIWDYLDRNMGPR